MKKITIILGLVSTLGIISCTKNSQVKNFGGEGELTLPPNQKLINITWKNDEIWYLTKPMKQTDSAETYIFHEESSWGVIEGTYKIIEVKK